MLATNLRLIQFARSVNCRPKQWFSGIGLLILLSFLFVDRMEDGESHPSLALYLCKQREKIRKRVNTCAAKLSVPHKKLKHPKEEAPPVDGIKVPQQASPPPTVKKLYKTTTPLTCAVIAMTKVIAVVATFLLKKLFGPRPLWFQKQGDRPASSVHQIFLLLQLFLLRIQKQSDLHSRADPCWIHPADTPSIPWCRKQSNCYGRRWRTTTIANESICSCARVVIARSPAVHSWSNGIIWCNDWWF